MQILFKGGQVYKNDRIIETDVLVQDGFIVLVAEDIALQDGVQLVNAKGCILSLGFCDLHVHLRQPGFEAKETIKTGSLAGAAGGYTTLCAMPNLAPVPDSLQSLQKQLDIIKTDAVIKVLPYASITKGQNGESLSDISAMAMYVSGFSDDGKGVQNEEIMRAAMREVAKTGKFIAAHCEDESLLPQDGITVQEGSALAAQNGWQGVNNESEWREVERDIRLAKETGCRLHICHASTAKTFELVRAAQAQGLDITCEVTPHNLILCCDDIYADNGKFKMNPPLRSKEDARAALAALVDGTACAVATDHAPHTVDEKNGGFAKSMNGVVGLETAFAVLYTKHVLAGRLKLETLLKRMVHGGYGVLGLPVPEIKEGEIANMVLLNLERTAVVTPANFVTKGQATPFENWQLKGWPILTMYNGEIVWQAQ